MIEIHLTVDTQADYQVVSHKDIKMGGLFNLGEISFMIFEMERIKNELIKKSYEIKPVSTIHGKYDEQKEGENKPP